MATTFDQFPQTEQAAEPTEAWWQSLIRSYLLRKTLKAFFTAFVVISLTFFLIRFLPSNPIELFIQDLIVQYGMPYHEAQDQASALFAIDLDRPMYLQYFEYLTKLAQGDLGTSILSPGTPVMDFIKRFLPWTVFSVGIALILSFTIGIVLGLLMAYKRESLLDHILTFTGIDSQLDSQLPAGHLADHLAWCAAQVDSGGADARLALLGGDACVYALLHQRCALSCGAANYNLCAHDYGQLDVDDEEQHH